jgi:DNA-directed RNA polymerase specialized sigma24 family protein
MPTSDRTRTSDSTQLAGSYHADENCQGGPASSKSGPEATERKATTRPEAAIAEQYLADPTNRETRERFAECCFRRLKSIASHIAFRPGMCPSFLGPDTFAGDVLSLAAVRLGTKMHTLRNAQSLDSWLYAIAFRAALDERNQIKRRGAAPVYWEAMERPDEDGNAVPVPDLLPKHSSSHCSPQSCEEQVSREDFVRNLVTVAIRGSASDGDAVRCFVRHAEGLSPHDLAAERNITAAQASSLFRRGRKRLRRIAEQGMHVRVWRR